MCVCDCVCVCCFLNEVGDGVKDEREWKMESKRKKDKKEYRE